jgi:hypothetical protein
VCLIEEVRNKSGSISIQIIDRSNRGYKVVESLGYSKNEKEIEILYKKALKRIDELENNLFNVSQESDKKEKIKGRASQIS